VEQKAAKSRKGTIMNAHSLKMTAGAVVLVMVLLVGPRSSSVLRAHGHDHSQHRPSAPAVAPRTSVSPAPRAVAPRTPVSPETTLRTIQSRQLPSLHKAILAAIRQIESGNSQAALVELKRAQTTCEALHKMIEPQVRPSVVNARCPIMGAPVQAANVSPSLIRSFEGGRVGFCCAGCPRTWDRLPYPEKGAKLAAVMNELKQE